MTNSEVMFPVPVANPVPVPGGLAGPRAHRSVSRAATIPSVVAQVAPRNVPPGALRSLSTKFDLSSPASAIEARTVTSSGHVPRDDRA